MDGIGKRLVAWYVQNHRDLPWRGTNDPYLIWVSEIILQQTQVATGLNYFRRITAKYPTVDKLAGANLDELLKLWQGLGYYSRARNMHHAAQQLMVKHQGVFPNTYKEIRALKGIGDYTAAAIASLAFGLPHAAVDGNVYRVIARLFGIETPIDTNEGKKTFQHLADQLMDRSQPGNHNQAMMELGALVCRPANPLCGQCPVTHYCKAHERGIPQNFPVKSRKTQTRTRYLNYILATNARWLYIVQRHGNDIWKKLFELPLVESEKEMSDEELMAMVAKVIGEGFAYSLVSIHRVKHQLSHQTLKLSFVHISANKALEAHPQWVKADVQYINKYAFPKPIASYLTNKLGGVPPHEPI